MGAITFDTMDYAEQLIESGVPQQQAKVQSKALKAVVDDIVSNALATKNDLTVTHTQITNKIAELELKIADLELKITNLELKIEKRFVRLEVFMSIIIAILVIPILKDLFL